MGNQIQDGQPTRANKAEQNIAAYRRLLREYLEVASVVIDATISAPVNPKTNDRSARFSDAMARVVIPMLRATGISCTSIETLSKTPLFQTRDCYSIARSIVESVINMVFILAEGEEEADRAYRHYQQKSYRDLHRTSRAGEWTFELRFEGIEHPNIPEDLEAAIQEFTSRRGKEKNWTDLSVEERVGRIGARFGKEVQIPIHAAVIGVYRHASEVLHGTLFGACHDLGLTIPGKGPANVEQVRTLVLTHLEFLLFCVVASIGAFFIAFDKAYDIPEMREVTDQLNSELWKIATAGKSGGMTLGSFRREDE